MFRDDYIKYAELNNLAAQANGLNDMSELWKQPYETDNFQQQMESILEEMKPFYEEIHAYTRMKLRLKFGSDHIDADTPIPASLLGLD